MIKVVLVEKGVDQKELFFDKDEVFIGRTANNGIVLPKPNVSKRHAVIQLKDGEVFVNDLKSTNGTWVGGRKIDNPQKLKEKDFIFIGDFAIGVSIVEPGAAVPTTEQPAPEPVAKPAATVAMPAVGQVPPPQDSLPEIPMPPPLPEDSVVDEAPRKWQPEPVAAPVEFEVEVEIEEPPAPAAPPPPEPVKQTPPQAAPEVAPPARKAPPAPQPAPAPEPVPVAAPASTAVSASASGVSGLAARLGYHDDTDRFAAMRVLADVAGREVFASVDPARADFSDSEWLKLSDAVMRLVDKLRRENRISSDVDPVEMTQQVLFEYAGLGPLEELLSSKTLRAVIVNGLDSIQVIDVGGSRTIDAVFSNENTFSRVVTKLCLLAGIAPAAASEPLIEGNLPDGSLLQIIGKPFIQDGRMIVIERPASRILSASELVSETGVSSVDLDLLKAALQDRRNIVVCGAPYTALSTFVNSLAAMVDSDRRVLVLGGGAEQPLPMPNLVSMNLSALAGSAMGGARLVSRAFPDHVVLKYLEYSDARLVQELALAGIGGMILGMVARSSQDCVDRLRLMFQFMSPGVAPQAVDSLTARIADVVVVLSLDHDGRTVISKVVSGCALTAGADDQVEIEIDSANGPATDPGIEPDTVVSDAP
ncbi:MAG TPA: FHA domain-containing protein [Myxococcota bacterium]|nr:FHA domain-containing protein [Myxococcota bacterium]